MFCTLMQIIISPLHFILKRFFINEFPVFSEIERFQQIAKTQNSDRKTIKLY